MNTVLKINEGDLFTVLKLKKSPEEEAKLSPLDLDNYRNFLSKITKLLAFQEQVIKVKGVRPTQAGDFVTLTVMPDETVEFKMVSSILVNCIEPVDAIVQSKNLDRTYDDICLTFANELPETELHFITDVLNDSDITDLVGIDALEDPAAFLDRLDYDQKLFDHIKNCIKKVEKEYNDVLELEEENAPSSEAESAEVKEDEYAVPWEEEEKPATPSTKARQRKSIKVSDDQGNTLIEKVVEKVQEDNPEPDVQETVTLLDLTVEPKGRKQEIEVSKEMSVDSIEFKDRKYCNPHSTDAILLASQLMETFVKDPDHFNKTLTVAVQLVQLQIDAIKKIKW